MAGAITVNNTFASQAGPIPLSQLDSNFTHWITAAGNMLIGGNGAFEPSTAPFYVVNTFEFEHELRVRF